MVVVVGLGMACGRPVAPASPCVTQTDTMVVRGPDGRVVSETHVTRCVMTRVER